MIKALLAWAGLRAAPCFHDPRVHDAMNADAAVMSGVRVVARRSLVVARTIAVHPEDVAGIDRRVEDMRHTMEELIRRTR